MTELIKLINKDFFPDFKTTLNEASGINDVKLPDGVDLTTLSKTDRQWNDLFKKYLNPDSINYYVITVNGFTRKTPDPSEPTQGFLKYTGTTGQEREEKEVKRLFRKPKNTYQWVNTLKSADVTIVSNETDATLFTAGDIDTIIDAIKRNADFDLKGTTFGRQKATDAALKRLDYSQIILQGYINKLMDKDVSSLFSASMGTLLNFCRQRQNPLVGNPLIDMLVNILKVNPNFHPTSRTLTTLNNLVADRVLSIDNILNPGNFKSSLCYNDNTYRYNETQIEQLFDVYDSVITMKGTITIPQLKIYQGDERKFLARNIIFIANEDDDPLPAIVKGTKEDLKLPELGFKPEGQVLTGKLRDIEAAKELRNAIFSANEVEEDEPSTNYFLNIGKESYQLTVTNRQNNNITGVFDDVYFTAGNAIEIQKGSRTVSLANIINNEDSYDVTLFKVDNKKLVAIKDFESNLTVTISGVGSGSREFVSEFKITNTQQVVPDEEEPEEEDTTTSGEGVPEGYEEIDPDGTMVGDEQQDVTVQVGDKVVGLDGNRIDVTAENIGQGKWNIKAGTKIWRLKPQPADTTTNSTGESFVGDKTLDDILKMTKDEFRTFSLGLTPEDKAKLKAFGGKLLAAK